MFNFRTVKKVFSSEALSRLVYQWIKAPDIAYTDLQSVKWRVFYQSKKKNKYKIFLLISYRFDILFRLKNEQFLRTVHIAIAIYAELGFVKP